MKTLTKRIIFFFGLIALIFFAFNISAGKTYACDRFTTCDGYQLNQMCASFTATVNITNPPSGKNIYVGCNGDNGNGYVEKMQTVNGVCVGQYCDGHWGGPQGQNWCQGEIQQVANGGIVNLTHCSCQNNPNGAGACLQVLLSPTTPTMNNACTPNSNPTINTSGILPTDNGCTVSHLACSNNDTATPTTISITCPPAAPIPGAPNCTGTTATLPFTWNTVGTNPSVRVNLCDANGNGCQQVGGSYTLPTGGQGATATGLTAGGSYTWNVTATADGITSTPAQGTPFTCGTGTTLTPPTIGTPTCTTTSNGTSATVPYTSQNNAYTYVYYCDKTTEATTKQCETWTAQPDGYLPPTGKPVSASPATINGLTAGDTYTTFVRACDKVNTDATAQCADSNSQGNATPFACTSNNTTLSFVIGLDGIGTTGDQLNPAYSVLKNTANEVVAVGSTPNPVHTIRPIAVLLTGSNNQTTEYDGNITYDSNQSSGTYGKFTGSIDLGINFQAGTYGVIASVGAHLKKSLGSINITNIDQDNHIGGTPKNLTAGDITGDTPHGTADADNQLTILDYNVLMSCIIYTHGQDRDLCNSRPQFFTLSDLEDNGDTTAQRGPQVDEFDYNLFLRELSANPNGDNPPGATTGIQSQSTLDVSNTVDTTEPTATPTVTPTPIIAGTGSGTGISTATTLDSPMHIAFDFYTQDLNSLKDPNLWRNELSAAYVALQDLTGLTPYNGDVITYKEVTAQSINNAGCLSGNPIQCSDAGLPGVISDVNNHNLLGFGQVHEMGHDFDLGFDSTDYLHGSAGLLNVEQWANFKLTYVADILSSKYPNTTFSDATLGYVPIGQFDQKFFIDWKAHDWINSSKADWTNMDRDAFTGLLDSLAKKYGWDIYKKTFAEYNTFKSAGKAIPNTDLGKIQLLADTLAKNAPAGNDINAQFKSWGIPIQ